MDELREAIRKFAPLTTDSENEFLQAWRKERVAKHTFLVREHDVADRFFYVGEGLVRIFYYKRQKEITEWIALDHSFFFSILSFFKQVPSRLQIHTLEPSIIYSIHHDDLMSLCVKYHDVEHVFRLLVQESLIMSQWRVDSLQFETAEQRYKKLMADFPSMIQRVPLSYIASFLGITQETLSRIRAIK